MIYGKNAWDNAHLSREEALTLLLNDTWERCDKENTINFWSKVLPITLPRMTERISQIIPSVLINLNPGLDEISLALKIKSRRWRNDEVMRISNLIHSYRQRRRNMEQENLHIQFQSELGNIGPIYTVWCHYLLNPKIYPPIDRFNYTAYIFIQNHELVNNLPTRFNYPFADSDYCHFQNWFISNVIEYAGGEYSVNDIISFDKTLLSLGAFLQKILNRN